MIEEDIQLNWNLLMVLKKRMVTQVIQQNEKFSEISSSAFGLNIQTVQK
jgi:hypothetical protein